MRWFQAWSVLGFALFSSSTFADSVFTHNSQKKDDKSRQGFLLKNGDLIKARKACEDIVFENKKLAEALGAKHNPKIDLIIIYADYDTNKKVIKLTLNVANTTVYPSPVSEYTVVSPGDRDFDPLAKSLLLDK